VVVSKFFNQTKELCNVPDAEFLIAMRRAWSQHKTSQLMIRDILMYMNSVYVPVNNVPNVYDMGLLLFRDTVARDSQIKRRLLEQLLLLIARERSGEVVDRSSLKSAATMLVELGCGSRDVYVNDFERVFLETTARTLRDESAARLATDGAPAYLAYADHRLTEELARVQQCLDQSTEARLRATAEQELLATHLKSLISMDTGLVSMLKLQKFTDLRVMYNLFGRLVDGHAEMRAVLLEHVKAIGTTIVNDEQKEAGAGGAPAAAAAAAAGGAAPAAAAAAGGDGDQATFIDALLVLRDEADQWLTRAFNNDKQFHSAVNQAFEHFINASPKSPEYLSLYVDNKLRRGLKGATEAEVELSLERAMALFRYIHEKDVFEKYYKQHLARRLLLARSVSDDAERAMISKLKREVGFQFTSKLEGMFTDVRVSNEMGDRFNEFVRTLKESRAAAESSAPLTVGGRLLVLEDSDADPLACDIAVHVLTTGFWPLQSVALCTLPPDVAAAAALFKRFYLDNHSGRRLAYQTNMGTADIKASFAIKKHELSVSTYQMSLLWQFNDKKVISARELQQLTGISQRDAWRSLAALCAAKHRILLRKRAGGAAGGGGGDDDAPGDANDKKPAAAGGSAAGAANDDDEFSLNTKFKSKLYKIRVGGAAGAKEEPAELSKTREKVEEDRKHQIEAALVRIMKSRKTLSHNELIAECTKLLQARFLANPLVIKKRIESLIEREYLARAKDDRKMLTYLA
jgi:cullin 3